MSDTSEGPGWWIASDGKWYPPESHPDAVAAGRPVAGAAGAAEDEPVTSPSGHNPGPRSRWLGSGRRDGVPPDAVGQAPTAPPTAAQPAPWGPVAAAVPVATSVPPRRGRVAVPWIVGVGIVVALAVAATVVALTSGSGGSLGPGAYTATIHASSSSPGHTSFSATVGGMALTGRVVSGSASAFEAPGATLVTYEGSLGATPYVLHVSLRSLAPEPQGSTLPRLALNVSGTYGSRPVRATASFSIVSLEQSSPAVTFTGTIGSERIVGQATVGGSSVGAITITAHFTVVR